METKSLMIKVRPLIVMTLFDRGDTLYTKKNHEEYVQIKSEDDAERYMFRIYKEYKE